MGNIFSWSTWRRQREPLWEKYKECSQCQGKSIQNYWELDFSNWFNIIYCRLWPALCGNGCRLDKATGKHIKAAGFSSVKLANIEVYTDKNHAFKLIKHHIAGFAIKWPILQLIDSTLVILLLVTSWYLTWGQPCYFHNHKINSADNDRYFILLLIGFFSSQKNYHLANVALYLIGILRIWQELSDQPFSHIGLKIVIGYSIWPIVLIRQPISFTFRVSTRLVNFWSISQETVLD